MKNDTPRSAQADQTTTTSTAAEPVKTSEASVLVGKLTANKLPATKPEQFVAKRKLTLDATSIARLKEVICRVDGEMETIEMPPASKGAPPSTAIALPIMDVITGQEYLLICNSLIVSALRRAGEPLTGRFFAMRAGLISAGKRYRQVDVVELELA